MRPRVLQQQRSLPAVVNFPSNLLLLESPEV